MNNHLKGGSLAYDYVMKNATRNCQNVHRGGKVSRKRRPKRPKRTKRTKGTKGTKRNKRRSGSTSKKGKNNKQCGGSDWVTMLYARGPASYKSTYDKKHFRNFTKTGKFYDSQGKLNKIGGGKNKKKKMNLNMNFLSPSVKKMPVELTNKVKKMGIKSAQNITSSAQRNLKDLSKELSKILETKIKSGETAAKRQMRLANERIKKYSISQQTNKRKPSRRRPSRRPSRRRPSRKRSSRRR